MRLFTSSSCSILGQSVRCKSVFLGLLGSFRINFSSRPLGSLEVSVSIWTRTPYQGTLPHLKRTPIFFRTGFFPAMLESHARNISAPPTLPDEELKLWDNWSSHSKKQSLGEAINNATCGHADSTYKREYHKHI